MTNSVISKTDSDTKVGQFDSAKILDLLEEYCSGITSLKSELSLDGKSIEVACKEQVAYFGYYAEKLSELSILLKYIDSQVGKVRGKLFYEFTEKSSISLSDRAKDKYIDKETKYLIINRLYLEVKQVHGQYDAAVESFKSRGFALNNIVKARVAQAEMDNM